MKQFQKFAQYDPSEILDLLGAEGDLAAGRSPTKYFSWGSNLILLVTVSGKSSDEPGLENRYDPLVGRISLYGRPHSHSQQRDFARLFRGDLAPQVFVQWSTSIDRFMYLGCPSIAAWADNVEMRPGVRALQIELMFEDASGIDKFQDVGPDGVLNTVGSLGANEGKQLTVLVNKYERNPSLRSACLALYGPVCRVCEFDFEKMYGDIGRDFCHVHHISPLAEVGEEHSVNPETDLIPVCANCHAMIHRTSPALQPSELKRLMRSKK